MAAHRMMKSSAAALLLLTVVVVPVVGAVEPRSRADSPSSETATARSLVATSTWAVVSTTSLHLNGTAFGNILSFSDGSGSHHAGTPYFFLSPMDPTLQDLRVDPRCSVAISQLGVGPGCQRDPQDPTCVKLTLSGKMVRATGGREEAARTYLFARHPEMASWPSDHGFEFHYLEVASLFLLDHYGGARHISPTEYYEYEYDINSSGGTAAELSAGLMARERDALRASA